MSKQTHIDWTDRTWNVFIGCTPVAAACDHCFAAREEDTRFRHLGRCDSRRTMRDLGERYFFNGPVLQGRTFEPIGWFPGQKVFVCPRSDLFHLSITFERIDEVFAIMAMRQDLVFQVLTKRSARRLQYIKSRPASAGWYLKCQEWLDAGSRGPLGRHWDRCHASLERIDLAKPLPNVWQLATVWDQASADSEIPLLLQTPAAIRGVSIEPMLGPVKLAYDRGDWCLDYFNGHKWIQDCDSTDADDWGKLHWVIAGGESGPGARPAHPDWFRSLRDQCGQAKVPFFFKQWGEWAPDCLCGSTRPHKTTPRPEPGLPGCMFRCGKKLAGHVLDGREHRECPK